MLAGKLSPARLCIPDFDRFIPAGRGQALPVRAISHASNKVGMPAKVKDLLAGGRVPDAHSFIGAGRGEALTIRAERHAVHAVHVSGQGLERGVPSSRALGIEVPDLGGPIPAGGGETPSVGAEGHTADMPFTALEL